MPLSLNLGGFSLPLEDPTPAGGGISDAPSDGVIRGRKNGQWEEVQTGNPFDQSLNTTDSVSFKSLAVDDIHGGSLNLNQDGSEIVGYRPDVTQPDNYSWQINGDGSASFANGSAGFDASGNFYSPNGVYASGYDPNGFGSLQIVGLNGAATWVNYCGYAAEAGNANYAGSAGNANYAGSAGYANEAGFAYGGWPGDLGSFWNNVGFITDAPYDDNQYVRQNGNWSAFSGGNPFDQSLNTTDSPTFLSVSFIDSNAGRASIGSSGDGSSFIGLSNNTHSIGNDISIVNTYDTAYNPYGYLNSESPFSITTPNWTISNDGSASFANGAVGFDASGNFSVINNSNTSTTIGVASGHIYTSGTVEACGYDFSYNNIPVGFYGNSSSVVLGSIAYPSIVLYPDGSASFGNDGLSIDYVGNLSTNNITVASGSITFAGNGTLSASGGNLYWNGTQIA